MIDKMQKQRFELKYLIPEETALRVRDYVRCYLDLDEYSVGKPNFSYPVHSLYLDSDDLRLYWETINGNKNRYKLRLRYYSVDPDMPVFFEIKRRMNNCILKQRGGVRMSALQHLLDGHHPEQQHLLSKDPRQLMAIQRFCHLMNEIRARPKVHIYYMREAYVSADGEARITLDRHVYGEPNLTPTLKTKMTAPVQSYKEFVILELKFTNRFPNWFRDVVYVANAMQCGAAKYVESISQVGSRKLNATGPVVEEESLLSVYRRGDDLPVWMRQDKSISLGPPIPRPHTPPAHRPVTSPAAPSPAPAPAIAPVGSTSPSPA